MESYTIELTGAFRKDLKVAKKRGLDMNELYAVVEMLRTDSPLPAHFHNHKLTSDYKDYWECHIEPDWLLIYEKDTAIRILSLYRTGTHADLFGKGKKR